jgi:tungstate transport system substrate-binding protein
MKTMTSTLRRLSAAALVLVGTLGSAAAADKFITVASTTSTEESGLFGFLLPKFKAKTGIDVHVVAQGTGQALKTGERGDADVVFVHDTASEKKFVAAGFGVERFEVMYNDFVVVGPKSDPAGVKGTNDVVAAFKKISASKSPFASRGDDSGTNKAELRLWKDAAIDIKQASGTWYRETGSGMGPTLNTSAAMNAYTLTDLVIVVEGDKKLFNQYGVMLVNPAKHPNVKKAEGQAFVDWLISPDGQKTIADYKINGEQLFFPNFKKSGS